MLFVSSTTFVSAIPILAEDNMERLVELFCHAMRISDPLSIQIAVGMVGGGIPLLFLYALFVQLGELVAAQREKRVVASKD